MIRPEDECWTPAKALSLAIGLGMVDSRREKVGGIILRLNGPAREALALLTSDELARMDEPYWRQRKPYSITKGRWSLPKVSP